MGTLNDINVVDNVTDVLAAQINALMGSNFRSDYSLQTTMAGTVTLSDADYAIQSFLCNGANRIVKLPPYATTNHPYFIINQTAATYTLDVQTNGGVSLLTTLLPPLTGFACVVPDGSAGFVLYSTNPAVTSVNSLGYPCNGRLTLTSALPVTTADVTAASTLYWSPYKGNSIALYDGASAWNVLASAEKSLALTLTSGSVYDIFGYNNGGVLALESLVWTNPTTRATALVLQDGVLVKSGATTRRYLGTICASATNQTEDSTSKRYVWNYYNRVPRTMKAFDNTNSWAWVTASYEEARGGSTLGTSRVGLVTGWSEDIVTAAVTGAVSASSGNPICSVGVGLDNATNAAQVTAPAFATSTLVLPLSAFYRGYTGVGFHFLAWLEYGGANVTFYGDNGGTEFQTGLVAEILA